jgi:hypothetical protein
MRKITLFLAAAALLAFSLTPAAQAATNMQPGLWEMGMQSDAMKNMPKLSPEQLEMMRKKGINMPDMKDGKLVNKVCISKEMAERDQPIDMHREQTGCQAKNYQRTSNGYTVDLVCDGPNMKGEGKARGTFASKESFSSTYDFKGTAHGQPVNQHMETTGKWLGADCGSVKPISEMVPKK